MRKLISIIAIPLALAACQPHKATKHLKTVETKMYHFDDGRVGYQTDDGFWYWMLVQQQLNAQPIGSAASAPAAISGSNLGFRGSYAGASFARGPAPTTKEIEEADAEEVEELVNEDGSPATEEEVSTEEAATEGEATEASPGGSETPSAPSESSTEAGSSSDSGGDSGGGGDGGGGGGGD